MTYVLWHLLDNPRMSPSLRWGFRAANIALNGARGSSRFLEMYSLAEVSSCSAQLVVVPFDDPLGAVEVQEAGEWKGGRWKGGRREAEEGAIGIRAPSSRTPVVLSEFTDLVSGARYRASFSGSIR